MRVSTSLMASESCRNRRPPNEFYTPLVMTSISGLSPTVLSPRVFIRTHRKAQLLLSAILIAVLLLAFNYSSAAATFDDELQALWKLDDGSGGTALDSSGNDNHGTLNGDFLWTTEGIGGSLNLNGDGDYVTVGVGSQYSDLCINGCSFGGWIKPNGQPAASRTYGIIGRYDYTDADMFSGSLITGGEDSLPSSAMTERSPTDAGLLQDMILHLTDGSMSLLYLTEVL